MTTAETAQDLGPSPWPARRADGRLNPLSPQYDPIVAELESRLPSLKADELQEILSMVGPELQERFFEQNRLEVERHARVSQ